MAVPLREFQLYQLDILKTFISICEKNDLKYWAAWGTLLGAARHNGFIPWDDDIDIWMPPKDYYKLREACKSCLPENYYFQSHLTNTDNFISWQRIGRIDSTSLPYKYRELHGEWGICIDIFPLGSIAPGCEQQTLRRIRLFDKLSQYRQYKIDARDLSGIPKIYHLMLSCYPEFINQTAWLSIESKLFNEFNTKSDDFVFCMAARSKPDRIVGKISCFDETIKLPFEDTEICVPKGYADVLSHAYGADWADLPPEEKRVCHSGGGSDEVLVSLTEPYAQYLI